AHAALFATITIASHPAMIVPPSRKATVPVAPAVTFAVKVTLAPRFEGFALEPTVVEEAGSCSGNSTASIHARSGQFIGAKLPLLQFEHREVNRVRYCHLSVWVPAVIGAMAESQPVSALVFALLPVACRTRPPSTKNSKNPYPGKPLTLYANETDPARNVPVYCMAYGHGIGP